MAHDELKPQPKPLLNSRYLATKAIKKNPSEALTNFS